MDHESRREQIGATAEQILVAQGWAGVTLRGIAAATGWSTGAIRHYFADQHTLRAYVAGCAEARLSTQVGDRVRRHIGPSMTTQDLAAMVCELLPLDEERRYEYALWVALVQWDEDQPPEQRSSIWAEQHALYRRCVAIVSGHPAASNEGPLTELDRRRESWTSYLHVLTDGLAMQVTHTPHQVRDAEQLVLEFLVEISELPWA